ncbi:MAG: PilX N-terminal domain-containing pilus assembly protein [Methylococcales bacterium]|nr:PilX N-terminal domain-containing pilus assembly protein [Methylococcales bacterium]
MNKRLSAATPIKVTIRVGRQCGAVLIVSLIILTLLTLIGLNSMQSTMLEEKMANNLRQHDLAFQAAEAALRDAEMFIESTDAAFVPLKLSGGPFQGGSCANGLCPYPTTTSVSFNWTTYGKEYGTLGGGSPKKISGIKNDHQPRYIIELINTQPSSDSARLYATFRITAFAWGNETNAVVRLQTIYTLHAKSFAF